ncbi:MAG: group I intron-associated PD-(D/E)XK endonuclease [Terriglobales bacterium]
MTNSGLDIKLPKARGEWAEMRFMARAAEHGLTVNKPWGESKHYDFAVEHEGFFVRVQVKSTMSRKKNNYGCILRGARVYYTRDDFDFLAVYIIPRDLWYIIPAPLAITGRQRLYLTPDYPRSVYEPYREAWHFLQRRPGESGSELCLHCGRLPHQREDPTIVPRCKEQAVSLAKRPEN